MGKKESKKDKNEKKDKRNVDKKKEKRKSGGIGIFQIASIIGAVVFLLMSVAIYKKYTELAEVPEMPNLELDYWWGPKQLKEPDTSIRPYRIMFTESMKDTLRKKFDFYRGIVFKKKSLNESWDYGINSEALAQMFAHWQFKYNMRERERFLNKFNHFKTNIQGLDIHFVHVKPEVKENVKVLLLPLLLLHGWPSTFRDFYEAIPLLVTPQKNYNFVFEVIVPSLPGFGYSQAPVKKGLSPARVAVIMRNLMQRLGIKKYYIQGGDFGHTIGTHMATLFPKEVLGLHTSFPINFSELAFTVDVLCKSFNNAIEKLKSGNDTLKDTVEFYFEESGYFHLQATKPDTIGLLLNDSPVGLLGYIVDKFMIFTDPNNKHLEDGGLSTYYSNTDLIDQAMIYWFSESITTAMRLYKESVEEKELEKTLSRIPTNVPTWALRTKYELASQPDCLLRWKYTNLVGTSNFDFGGHFIAFERPKEFAENMFLAVDSFRKIKV